MGVFTFCFLGCVVIVLCVESTSAVKLHAPTNLGIVRQSDEATVKLTWNEPSDADGIEKYQIDMINLGVVRDHGLTLQSIASGFRHVADVNKGTHEKIVASLRKGNYYLFRIKSIKTSASSKDDSDYVQWSTIHQGGSGMEAANPLSIGYTGETYNSITVEVTEPSHDRQQTIGKYQFICTTVNRRPTVVEKREFDVAATRGHRQAISDSGKMTYAITGLDADTYYRVKVRSLGYDVGGVIQSVDNYKFVKPDPDDAKKTTSKTDLTRPSTVTAAEGSDSTSMVVRWVATSCTNSETDCENFEIEVREVDNNDNLVTDGTPVQKDETAPRGQTSKTVTGLTAGKKYRIRVRAKATSNGPKNDSDWKTATFTLSGTPSGAPSVSHDRIMFWTTALVSGFVVLWFSSVV